MSDDSFNNPLVDRRRHNGVDETEYDMSQVNGVDAVTSTNGNAKSNMPDTSGQFAIKFSSITINICSPL